MRFLPRPGFFIRLLLFAFLWWILTQGEASSWWWGVPVLLLAAWITPVLPTQYHWRWRLLPLLRMLPRFLLLSARGGWEVALLALGPRPQLNTRLVDYTWCCLPEGPPQLFMASLINLIPGTLTIRPLPDQDCLHIHILNYRSSTLMTLRKVEVNIAELYGLPVSSAVRKAI